MNLSEVRDLVKLYLTEHGAKNVAKIPTGIIDNMINAETQMHFSENKSQKGFWHTLAQAHMDEYVLPDGILSPTLVKVANEIYYPVSWPYYEGVRSSSAGRTLTTEDGYTVDSVRDRYYWIDGNRIFFNPEPQEDTGEETSGACTVSGSIVTISSGTLGANNSLKRRLAMVKTSYFVITSNSASAFTVDGSPDTAAENYTIYNHGIEIHGPKLPTSLTIGSTDELPGNDLDAYTIALKSAFNVALTLPMNNQINMIGLRAVADRFSKQAKQNTLNKAFAPKNIEPYALR